MKPLKYFILILIAVLPNVVSAKRYQIKMLNTPNIVIGGKSYKVGDWFDDRSAIRWSSPKQAMKVVSDDNKLYTLSATSYRKSKPKTFKDFIFFVKPLATRGGRDDVFSYLEQAFDAEYVMMDQIAIDLTSCTLPPDSYFVFTGEDERGQLIEFQVSHNGKELFINRNEIEGGLNLSGQIITLRVELVPKNGNKKLITKYLEIEVCPLWII